MKLLFTAFLLITTTLLSAQKIEGILLNKSDSSVLTFATIKLVETGDYTLANEKGKFSFNLAEKLQEVHLEISHVSCHTTTLFKPNEANLLYVECSGLVLDDVLIEGLSAQKIVEKAIRKIPANYPSKSYAIPAFYRQYQKKNGAFGNLIEVKGLVMLKLEKKKKQIISEEALAVSQMRRSNYYKTEYFDQDDFLDFMKQNPIYHLENSLLSGINLYHFQFDPSSPPNAYVINYTCHRQTTENHGISNYEEVGLKEEGWETGQFTIDKESYAFIKIERKAFRHPGYNYPYHNNFVLPKKTFTQEFVEGYFGIEYRLEDGKWYLKTLLHRYSNTFFQTRIYKKAYTITENFELYAAKPTRYIDEDLADQFYATPSLTLVDYLYNPLSWKKPIPPFHFFKQEDIFQDLENEGEVEQQFLENGKLKR